MSFINVEIKARSTNADFIRKWLLDYGAEFKGVDRQVDTYFNVHQGRLKLREGNIENNLIRYQRENQAGPKTSNFDLFPVKDAAQLKKMLTESLGIKTIVEKSREIYYINNVKFHIDEVSFLGDFVEIEAGNLLAPLTQKELLQQCEYYVKAFGITDADLITHSYSDMMLEQEKNLEKNQSFSPASFRTVSHSDSVTG